MFVPGQGVPQRIAKRIAKKCSSQAKTCPTESPSVSLRSACPRPRRLTSIRLISARPRPRRAIYTHERYGVGMALVLFWYCIGISFGMVLGLFWYVFSMLLVWCWYCFGMLLVWCWYCQDLVFGYSVCMLLVLFWCGIVSC